MENAQPALFVESINDALREAVRALGGPKKVGAKLKPEKLVDAAGRWVSDCLNPDHAQKFDPDHVLWLLCEARRVGCHTAMEFVNQEAGYAKPVPVEPEDERAALMRHFIESTKTQARIAERLEALTRANP